MYRLIAAGTAPLLGGTGTWLGSRPLLLGKATAWLPCKDACLGLGLVGTRLRLGLLGGGSHAERVDASASTPTRCAGTMEEIIYDRQLYKQMHAQMAMEGQEDMPRTFTGAEGVCVCAYACWSGCCPLEGCAGAVGCQGLSLAAPHPPTPSPGANTGFKEDRGELFGMVNLLRHNRDAIMTLDLVERVGRRESAGLVEQAGARDGQRRAARAVNAVRVV